MMLCIHVNSIARSYQDMVAMEPIVNNSADIFFELFDQCLQMLKLSTDNHRVNQKFISEKLNELEIYAWYDQGHIAKNMY